MVVIVPHVPIRQPEPSPEAKEVGTKIAELVRILRQGNPRISAADVRTGLRVAEQELRPEIGGNPAAKWLLVVGLLVGAALLGVFVFEAQNQGGGPAFRWLMVAIGALVVVLGGIAVMRRA
jgi:hypothetical protein